MLLAADPTSTPDPASTLLHSMWTGLTQVAADQPWLVVLVAVLVATALVRSARVAIHSGPRDPIRCFTRVDKRILLDRAGHRCEHHNIFGARCRATDRLEADHVHPHSRGGWTNVSNGQILCHGHNREKSAAIPWDRSLRRLAERRAAYYPADVERFVTRRPPRRAARNVRGV